MGPRLAALGYREIILGANGIFGPAGTRLRGHEFHYSRMDPMPEGIERFYESKTTGGEAGSGGYRYRQTVAGYTHVHFGSNPEAARAFVRACRARGSKTEFS
jgi:cobyrinic acid a,c-diamide synthase